MLIIVYQLSINTQPTFLTPMYFSSMYWRGWTWKSYYIFKTSWQLESRIITNCQGDTLVRNVEVRTQTGSCLLMLWLPVDPEACIQWLESTSPGPGSSLVKWGGCGSACHGRSLSSSSLMAADGSILCCWNPVVPPDFCTFSPSFFSIFYFILF